MGFFSKTFSAIKTGVISTLVSSKLDKTETKLRESIRPIKRIIYNISEIYKDLIDGTLTGSADIIKNNKSDVVSLVTENYETINKIIELAKSLDTERNRKLIGQIAKSIAETTKKVDDDMQSTFKECYEEPIMESATAVTKMWGLKPRKKKISDVTDAQQSMDIAALIGEGKKVLIRKTYDFEGCETFTMQCWIDNEEIDVKGFNFSWNSHDLVDTIETGLITDLYFYDIALDTKEQIDSRF
jgi:hypothetical protein